MTRPSDGGAVAHNIGCFLGIVLWSFAFPAQDVLLETWGGISLSLARMCIGSLALLAAWAVMDGLAAVTGAPWRRGLAIGGGGFGLGTILLFIGQNYSDAVTPAIAIAMMPVASATIEIVFDKRRLRLPVLTGIALALVGGYLATGVRLSDGRFGLGAAMCLIAVFMYAWATRATTRDLPSLSAVGRTALTLVGAAVSTIAVWVLAAASGLSHAVIGDYGLDSTVLILVIAIPSLAIAQLLWIWTAGHLGVLVASLHMNAMPFYVMIIVVVVLGESWSWDQAVGAALVAAGVITAQLRRRRPGRERDRVSAG